MWLLQLSERRAKAIASIKTAKDPRRRPSPSELQTQQELGQGNFTRILQVLHRETREVFALKVIEKSQVKASTPQRAQSVGRFVRRLILVVGGHPRSSA